MAQDISLLGALFQGVPAITLPKQGGGTALFADPSDTTALRVEIGKSKDGTKGQLSLWVHRKFITFSSETGLYTKTNEYLSGSGLTVKG